MKRKILLCTLAALAAACGGGEERPASAERELPDSGGGSEGAASGLAASPDSATDTAAPVVLFLGTSLTAGYGLSSDHAFPALVQAKIDSAGLAFRAVNAGVSGETSAGGLRRLDWLLRQPIAVLVLELGANDMLRGQDVEALRDNLRRIIERTREAYPDARVVIAGMKAAPNLGERYVGGFEAVYRELADETGAALIPFLLEGVAGVPELNQPDGNHPTAEGHKIIAETVWRTLGPLLRELAI